MNTSSSSQKKKYSVVLVDDHNLIRKALVDLINNYENFRVLFDVSNSREFKEKLSASLLPDIILLDLNMPGENGIDTISWVAKKYPKIKAVALTMSTDENTILKVLKAGAKGYLFKNLEVLEFRSSLEQIIKNDFFLHPTVSNKLCFTDGSILNGLEFHPNKKEALFLHYLSSEMSYKEIAVKMHVSPRTIEDYKEQLCAKLNVRTRIGLVIVAIRDGVISLENLVLGRHKPNSENHPKKQSFKLKIKKAKQ